MPLDSGALLAPHFTAHELAADDPAIPDAALANLRTITAPGLEVLRGVIGTPLDIDSGWRSWEHNAAIGGDPNSDHPNGLAADFKAEGLTPYQVYTRLKAAEANGQLPPFDQFIFYALDNHVHVGFGAGMRREWLLKGTEGSYATLASSVVAQIRGFV